MTLRHPRVLLTGASGFIGKRLARHLVEAGYAVTAPTRATLDLEDRAATLAFVAALDPDAILHLASPAMAVPGWSDSAIIAREVAVAETIAAATPPRARLIQTGSMAEYGRSGRHAEADACTPVTLYGRAKAAAAQAIRAAAETRGIDATNARIFGAYGPGEAERRLFQHVLAMATREGPIPLSDGAQRRDFVQVDDVCRALLGLLALPHRLAPVYPIGSGVAVSVRSAVERIAREAGIDPARLHFGAVERSLVDEDWLEADPTLLRATLGWAPPQHFVADAPLLPLLRDPPRPAA